MLKWIKGLTQGIVKYHLVIIATFFVILAVWLRYFNIDFLSNDYNAFLKNWWDEIIEKGRISSLGYRIGDYSPGYILFMTALSYLPISSLYAIKTLSILFDILLAIASGFLVLEILRKAKNRLAYATITFILILFLPTVIMNSSLWAQCDSIYTTFIILSLTFVVKKQNFIALIFFSIAFAFKLQAIFVLPLFIYIYLLNTPNKLYHFLVIPVIYYLLAIPSFIFGRSFIDVSTIYFGQIGQYANNLTMNMPNLYAWLPKSEEFIRIFLPFGLSLFAALMACSLIWMIHHNIKIKVSYVLDLTLWMILMAVYFLPAMHDRYLYMADVLSIIYFLVKQKNGWIPVAITVVSLSTYLQYLFGYTAFPFESMSILFGVTLGFLTKELFTQLKADHPTLDSMK